MPITPNFTQADIKARFDRLIDKIEIRQIKRLQYLGERCVEMARNNGDYTDQTSNLRSSVGYMVFKNGVAVHEGYELTGEGLEGLFAGKQLAKKAGAKYRNGICLVVTAGMHYALMVESNGRDVLTSAELFAKQEAPKMLAELVANIRKALDPYDSKI